MKTLHHISHLAVLGMMTLGSKALAATIPNDYLIVKDLPFIGQTTDLGGYLNGLFQLGIGIAVTLAIVMLVINGITYMFSDIPGVKVGAKNNLGNIVWGLLLAFSAWLILYTINPNLVKFDLIRSLDQAAGLAGQDVRPPQTPGDMGPWPSDARERAALKAANIGVNGANCTTIGQEGCTSVYNLSQRAIEGLINLKNRCNCAVTVTAGTEYWLHTAHGDKKTVDLRASPDLNTYIGGVGSTCFEDKTKDGIVFQWEAASCPNSTGDHWHVSF